MRTKNADRSPATESSTFNRWGVWWLVIVIYVAVAASTFGGFFSKWAFRDGSATHSLIATMDGTAARPFVYRQFIPYLSELVVKSLPESLADSFKKTSLNYPHISDTYTKATDAKDENKALRYRTAYYLVFLAWLGALALLAIACHQATRHTAASVIAPLIFANLFPFLQTRGGYFYDPVEMAFLAGSVVVACGRFKFLIVVLAPLATLNKEAFPFWLLCLIPFFWSSDERYKNIIILGISMAASCAVYYLIRTKFSDNIGSPTENHLVENIKFYATPSAYFGTEYTYGLPFPRGVSLLNLFAVFLVIRLSWGKITPLWRRHLLLSLAINFPLFIAFCWRDELRNLSFLFVGFVVLLATGIESGLRVMESPSHRSVPR